MVLSELAQRILAELEEAGEDSIATLLNTCIVEPCRAEHPDELGAAITELIPLGLATISIGRGDDGRLADAPSDKALQYAATLKEYVVYSDKDKVWLDIPLAEAGEGEFVDPMNAVSSQAGRDVAFDILDQRGYRWWRKKG
jgi:hypothetical protein